MNLFSLNPKSTKRHLSLVLKIAVTNEMVSQFTRMNRTAADIRTRSWIAIKLLKDYRNARPIR